MHENETLTDATTEYGTSVKVYDDREGTLWVAHHEFGAFMVIRAKNFNCAWEIMIDEMSPLDVDDVHDAFGFYVINNPSGGFYLCSDLEEFGHKEFIPEFEATHRICDRCDSKGQLLARARHFITEKQLNLIDGYEFQANATGTGIVCVGPYVQLRETDEDYLAHDYGLILEWTPDEAEQNQVSQS